MMHATDTRRVSIPKPSPHFLFSAFSDVVIVGTVQRLVGLRVFFETGRPLVVAQSVRSTNRDRTVPRVTFLARPAYTVVERARAMMSGLIRDCSVYGDENIIFSPFHLTAVVPPLAV